MIRFLKHNEIDRQKWDECIRLSFNGIIYAYSWYLDVVCPSWEALVAEDYKVVMPLPAGRKFGIDYLYPPFFVQQLGVFSVKRLTNEDVQHFLAAIPARFRYWELNLNTFNKLEKTSWRYAENLTHELDLIEPYEKLAASYSENTRRNIKKATAAGFKATADVPREIIISLFRSGRGQTIEKLKEQHYDLLRNLLRVIDSRGKLHVRAVTDADGAVMAGAFFVDSNGKVIFLFSGTAETARNTGALAFLVDAFIRENAQKNLVLDFEGSNDANLARFYKSFGAKECIYLQVRKNELPWPLRYFKK